MRALVMYIYKRFETKELEIIIDSNRPNIPGNKKRIDINYLFFTYSSSFFFRANFGGLGYASSLPS